MQHGGDFDPGAEALLIGSDGERCLGRCENAACGHTLIAYNSCRNRHCPKCQAATSRRWLADREAELLPVPYFHVVYTLPSKLRDIAYQNKRVVYDLLMKAAALPLHPSCRHLESPPHCSRRRRRRVPLEGLPRRRPGALEDDAAASA